MQSFLQFGSVDKAVRGENPTFAGRCWEVVDIGGAAHPVLLFELGVAEAPGKVDLPVDTILLSLLEDDPAPVYNSHQLLLISQVVRHRELLYLFLFLQHSQQLAVAQVGHVQTALRNQHHQSSAALLKLANHFLLHLRED